MAILDDVGFHARFSPGALAAVDLTTGERWNYFELDADISRCAAVLAGKGLASGDRVASYARNRILLAILHLACARLGLIYVPLNWRLSPPEVEDLIALAEPGLLVHDDGDARGCPGMALAELAQAMTRAEPLAVARGDPDLPSLILFTSGTSGRPKGAMLSERNCGETAINFSQLGKVTATSCFLVEAPMFHILGLLTTVRSAFRMGGTVLMSDGFEAARTLVRLADPALAVTHYFCVPQMAAALRGREEFDPAGLKGLTAVFTGGAPLTAADAHAWLADGVVVANGYGMSECGTLTGMPPVANIVAAHPESAGISTARMQIRIVDARGQALPDGEPGELQVFGPNVTSGYWRMPEETARAFTSDGWFRTGDVAKRTPDGFYSIVDRTKDMFISGGENVYPAEIEAALMELAGVAELAVVGVPDAKWGEVGHVAIVVREAAAVGLDEVLAHLEGRLARYKLPRHCATLEALPRTGSGKVRKNELRALLIERNRLGACE